MNIQIYGQGIIITRAEDYDGLVAEDWLRTYFLLG